jgi:hypothetical protein
MSAIHSESIKVTSVSCYVLIAYKYPRFLYLHDFYLHELFNSPTTFLCNKYLKKFHSAFSTELIPVFLLKTINNGLVALYENFTVRLSDQGQFIDMAL